VYGLLVNDAFQCSWMAICVVVCCDCGSTSQAANLGRHQHASPSSQSATTTTLLLATSFLYVGLSLSNWQLCSDLLFLVPLGGYVGRTCDGLLITDVVRQRYVIIENALSALDSLCALVYAYNFVIYVVTGAQFRGELRRIFCSCV